MEIIETIYAPFQKGPFLPVLTVSATFRFFVSDENNWNQLNNWKNHPCFLFQTTTCPRLSCINEIVYINENNENLMYSSKFNPTKVLLFKCL